MLDIFTIDKKNNVKIDLVYLGIPEFAKIWSADKTAQKATALSHFQYIYFTSDPRSKIIQSQPKDKVEETVKKYILGKPTYRASKDVIAAKKAYLSLMDVKSLKLLNTASSMIDGALKHLENMGEKALAENFSTYIKNLEAIPKLVDSYSNAYKRVLAEMDNTDLGGIVEAKSKIEKPEATNEDKLDEEW